jgi:prolipoprotein diacylglyceryltransferase
VVRPGRLFVIYVLGYGIGRLWVESLRIDTASKLGPLRVNEWMSLVLIGGSLLYLALRGLRRRPDDTDEPYRDGHRWVAGHRDDEPTDGDGDAPEEESVSRP